MYMYKCVSVDCPVTNYFVQYDINAVEYSYLMGIVYLSHRVEKRVRLITGNMIPEPNCCTETILRGPRMALLARNHVSTYTVYAKLMSPYKGETAVCMWP